jgi:hypothetical protein
LTNNLTYGIIRYHQKLRNENEMKRILGLGLLVLSFGGCASEPRQKSSESMSIVDKQVEWAKGCPNYGDIHARQAISDETIQSDEFVNTASIDDAKYCYYNTSDDDARSNAKKRMGQ